MLHTKKIMIGLLLTTSIVIQAADVALVADTLDTVAQKIERAPNLITALSTIYADVRPENAGEIRKLLNDRFSVSQFGVNIIRLFLSKAQTVQNCNFLRCLLLLNYVNANMQFPGTGYSLLMYVCSLNAGANFLKVLLDCGADPDLQHQVDGRTALMLVADNGNYVALHALLDKRARVDITDRRGETAFIKSMKASKKDIRVFNSLLRVSATRSPEHPDLYFYNGMEFVLTYDSTSMADTTAQTVVFTTDADMSPIEFGAFPVKECCARSILSKTPNASPEQVRRYFFECVQADVVEEVDELLKTRRVDVNVKSSETGVGGRTALLIASFLGNILVVRRLLQEKDCDVNSADDGGVTPLYVASLNGHGDIVTLLLAAGAIVDKANNLEMTPLHAASQEGHEAVIELLLAAGADVNHEAKDGGVNCLWRAAKNNRLATVLRYLQIPGVKIDNQADCDCKCSPLSLAFDQNNPAMLSALLQAGANAKKRYQNGRSLLHRAAGNNNVTMMNELFPYSDVNQTDDNNHTPLFFASGKGCLEAVQRLVNASGIDVDRVGNVSISSCPVSVSPLLLAAFRGYSEIVAALLAAGADPNLRDSLGRTALHNAAINNHEGAVKALLDSPLTDVKAEDASNKTAAKYAADKGNSTIVRLIIERLRK